MLIPDRRVEGDKVRGRGNKKAALARPMLWRAIGSLLPKQFEQRPYLLGVSVFEYIGLHRIKGLLSDGILPDVEHKFTRLDQHRR